MSVKLLTEHHLEFLGLKGGCRGSFKSTHVPLLEISCTGPIGIFVLAVTLIVNIQNISKIHGLEVIKLETSLRLKIKCNDWLLADTCPRAANHYALF